MKKLALLWLFLSCFFFVWCGNQYLWKWESIYAENLIIAWVGPEISFEPTIEEWTLVLKRTFEDKSVHVFLNKWMWENYLKKESDYLPWNEVNFKWVVEFIDWAAGNHYYNAKSIEQLEVKNYPNADEIKNLFEWYNYCESDSDCWYFMWECPLWCYIPLNVKYIDVASNIVTNFVNHLWDERCVYSCMFMDKAICNNNKCEMANLEDVKFGESVVEWDSEYFRYAMNILEKEWIVYCDMSYSDSWKKEAHSMFVADKDRFYSTIDDYSAFTRNVYFRLAKNGKIYEWSSIPDSESLVTDSKIDTENEIANIIYDLWKKSNFRINCYNWADEEHIFNDIITSI